MSGVISLRSFLPVVDLSPFSWPAFSISGVASELTSHGKLSCFFSKAYLCDSFFIITIFYFFKLLRDNVCNFRESVDSREFLNFFIFCPNNLYSTLISKITLKLVTAFYFFRNRAKFEKR